MRFEVSRVMDAIERRLTTDVTLAQASVDIEEVARFVELDGGRSISLLRLGLVLDALGRYLMDEGAMLYPVASRALLSVAELTSKERMVLGRWADDGLIEITPDLGDRVVEVADYIGVPVITSHGYFEYAHRFPWLREAPERSLWLLPRHGGAVLSPGGGAPIADEAEVVVGKAPFGGTAADGTPVPLRVSSTRMAHRRLTRVEPSAAGAALTARSWNCPEPGCSAFGGYRRIGQPVPRMRDATPTCPRHDAALVDDGQRPMAYAVVVVVDDIARRRFVVTGDRPVVVGMAPDNPDDVGLTQWLRYRTGVRIDSEHLYLQATDDGLSVTDTSTAGSVVHQRGGPHERSSVTRLSGTTCQLGEWDSIELDGGVELLLSDRRRYARVRSGQPDSVMVDAPTVSMRRLGRRK